jgi:cytidylate kinase
VQEAVTAASRERCMSKIITIGREFGSGGRLIARSLAQKLNVPFYDKEIVHKASEISGLDEKFVEDMEQKLNTRLLFNVTSNGHFFSSAPDSQFPPLEDQVFFAECKVIRAYADKGPCVIVGRCADFILKDKYDSFNIFIYAPVEQRVERLKKYYQLDSEDYEERIKKIDKLRARHYEFYTDRKWGMIENYDLSIDSGKFGIEGTTEILAAAGAQFFKN